MKQLRSKLHLLPMCAIALYTFFCSMPVPQAQPASHRTTVAKKKKAVKKTGTKTVTNKPVASSHRAAPKKQTPSKAKQTATPIAKKKPVQKKTVAPKRTVKKTAAVKKPAVSKTTKKPAKKNGVAAKPIAKKPATKKVAAQPKATFAAAKAAPKASEVMQARQKALAKSVPAVKRAAPSRVTQPKTKAAPTPRPTVRPKPKPTPTVTPTPVPAAPVQLAAPPTAQAYVAVKPRVETSYGQTMVPVTFIADGIGASIGPISTNQDGTSVWRISYFEHVADLYPYQTGAVFDGKQVTLPTAPMIINNVFYVPWQPIADFLGIKWSIAKNAEDAEINADSTTMLVQFPASYIEDIKHSNSGDRTRVVVQLSNATRIVAARKGQDVQFFLSAARTPNVPAVHPINDYLVPRAVTRSGNWQASVSVRINYAAPVRWFTLGSPPRLVIDLQKVFEEQTPDGSMDSGLSFTKIRKGLNRGPVQMFLTRVDPREGWRVRVAPAGYSTLQRNRTSVIAARNKALVAVNGGFFAYDGAAVGAMMVNGEWIRLPWGGRTAIGFRADGSARIDNLQVTTSAVFSSGLRIAVADLNGWPDKNRVTALTSRFRSTYKLRAGEIGLLVQNGKVVSKPGSGLLTIPANGFLLVANGGAVPWLNKVQRGENARLNFYVPGWEGITSALGAGPRLVRDGKVDVTATRENFRDDVKIGTGPRTAIGIDADGRLIILVVDGRKPYYSTGLTLNELAATMIKLGAVDAMNLDGGGSTALAVRSKLVNRPSDGFERAVANALIVTR